MINGNARLELVKQKYESLFKDTYKIFNLGHNQIHMKEVIDFGFDILGRLRTEENKGHEIDESILWMILAGHDLGLINGRASHEETSGQILRHILSRDKDFSHDEIDLIVEAISEHRSSKNTTSLYAEILKDADKVSLLSKERTLERVVGENFFHNRNKYEEICFDVLSELTLNDVYDILNNGKHRHHFIMDINKDLPICKWEDITKEEIMQYIKSTFGKILQ